MVTRSNIRSPRSSERGAAVFIVVMVITVLAAIGVFAVRSASLAQLASGYVRQSAQNQHISEYGLLAVVTEMNTLRRDLYRTQMVTRPSFCYATQHAANPACYKFNGQDIQVNVTNPLFESAVVADGETIEAGSLGPLPMMPLFAVEMFDLGPAARATPGSDVGGTSGTRMRYEQVTAVSTGRVQLDVVGSPICSDEAVAGTATTKAFLIIGPIAGS